MYYGTANLDIHFDSTLHNFISSHPALFYISSPITSPSTVFQSFFLLTLTTNQTLLHNISYYTHDDKLVAAVLPPIAGPITRPEFQAVIITAIPNG